MTRLNARIDDDLAAKLAHLQARTRLSITEIVRASIELYYQRFREQEALDPHRIFEEAGFIGCGEAEADLSTDYKESLHATLSGKAGT